MSGPKTLYERIERALRDELNPLINLERGEYEAPSHSAAVAAVRELQGGDGPVPFDPEHPDYCLRDRGCCSEAGHDGPCDLRAAI